MKTITINSDGGGTRGTRTTLDLLMGRDCLVSHRMGEGEEDCEVISVAGKEISQEGKCLKRRLSRRQSAPQERRSATESTTEGNDCKTGKREKVGSMTGGGEEM